MRCHYRSTPLGDRCTLDDDAIGAQRGWFLLTRAFIKSTLPFCEHYYVSSFRQHPTSR